ncbi:MAG: hypothetical protein ACYTF1_26240 [Planctomycetota bacterium]|jgi:hypothetical protein
MKRKSARRYVDVIICVLTVVICSPAAVVAEEKETFGARPDALGPLGGGKGYKKIVIKGDYMVGTIDELVEALSKAGPGQVVYVDNEAELDFSVRVRVEGFILEVPGGVTLAGGRGHKGPEGALLRSDEFKTKPLIKVTGPKARITGLRIYGPDPKMRRIELPRLTKIGGSELYYKFPTSDGIKCEHPFLEVDNCEIMGWSHAGVYLLGKAAKGHVHHNYIHHCQRRGLGYGICLNGVQALIESNMAPVMRPTIIWLKDRQVATASICTAARIEKTAPTLPANGSTSTTTPSRPSGKRNMDCPYVFGASQPRVARSVTTGSCRKSTTLITPAGKSAAITSNTTITSTAKKRS